MKVGIHQLKIDCCNVNLGCLRLCDSSLWQQEILAIQSCLKTGGELSVLPQQFPDLVTVAAAGLQQTPVTHLALVRSLHPLGGKEVFELGAE